MREYKGTDLLVGTEKKSSEFVDLLSAANISHIVRDRR